MHGNQANVEKAKREANDNEGGLSILSLVTLHCLNGRLLKPGLLDTLPPEEASASLADLVRVNKYWGGQSTLRKLVDRVILQ